MQINNILSYLRLKGIIINNKIPKAYIPIPSNNDYIKGNIKRYFLQEAENKTAPIIEVSSEEYSKYSQQFYYKKIELEWKIIGELEDKKVGGTYYPSVVTANRKSIDEAAKIMPAIRNYLVNLKQFWKPL